MRQTGLWARLATATFLVTAAVSGLHAQDPAPEPAAEPGDSVAVLRPGQFDTGKMWTFESAPLEYFQQAYGFQPTEAWLARVRLAALRLPNCSASFVSARGLVMTNHHCFRDNAASVAEPGEDLLETGFIAEAEDDERRIPDLYVDQLVEIRDVTEPVRVAESAATSEDEAVQARDARIASLAEELGEETGLRCDVTSLYHGGKYSAYCYRRYEDVRLVFAPELEAAHFGGDPDNFTYPRYSFDVTFLRVYGEDGEPYQPEHYLGWDVDGAEPGAPVFVIGNPGSTSRLFTVSQLEFLRDLEYPLQLGVLESRVALLQAYMDEFPEKRPETISMYLGITNQVKANTGAIEALRDGAIFGRKAAFERVLRDAVAADPDLTAAYGRVWDDIATIRQEMAALLPDLTALNQGSDVHSTTMLVALLAFQYAAGASNPNVDPEVLQEIRATIEEQVVDPELDRRMLEAQLQDAVDILGSDDPAVRGMLGGRSPSEAAALVIEESQLVDSTSRSAMLDDPQGILRASDPAIAVVRATLQRLFGAFQQYQALSDREELLTGRLARAIFEVYGEAIPPDATFTLRLADGVVEGYAYNGTQAPAHTTFYGMYDRHYANPGDDNWALPARWTAPPPEFDLSTPLNLVSTNDIIGGNSGSPLIDQDGDVIGLIFDGNIESLSGQFIYTTEAARSVSVHAAGIIEAMRDLYGARRVVDELLAP